MANDEHVALLKQGVDAWNAWRRENHYDIRPNLRAADLRQAEVRAVEVRREEVRPAEVRRAEVRPVE
jgi:hypothetical protein